MNSSKKLVPNNLKVAKKNVKDFTGVTIPEEINESEAHLVHAVIINSTPVPPTGWKHEAKVQMFHKNTIEVQKENLTRLGYTQLFIFHDPRLGEAKPADQGGDTGGAEGAGAGQPAAELSYHEKLAILRNLKAIEGTPNKEMVETVFEDYKNYMAQAKELEIEIAEEMTLNDIIAAIEEAKEK